MELSNAFKKHQAHKLAVDLTNTWRTLFHVHASRRGITPATVGKRIDYPTARIEAFLTERNIRTLREASDLFLALGYELTWQVRDLDLFNAPSQRPTEPRP